MIKKLTMALAAVLCTLGLAAQEYSGGVRGTVVSRSDRTPVAGASLALYQGAALIGEATSDGEGNFLIENLEDGMYDLVINATDFLETRVNVTVNDGYVKNMFNLSLSPARVVTEVDDASFAEFDLDDSGYDDAPTILFGQNDVFNEIAGYNFSAVRFRNRGYSSESQDVYLAGVKMNDAMTGYTPFSLWSGLNEATRTKYTVNGTEVSDYGMGGYNGLTDIPATASTVRKGWRGSVLTNSALYRLRLMLTYASGPLDNGWSYAFSASTRLGGNDWIKGVYYRSFGYYGSVEKKWGDVHNLGFVFMAAPGSRGAQNASTQEVYDLMGDNMYNSNWGYQNGVVRNSRVRKTHEPIAILKYDFTPSETFKASATILYRFGKNGYTALDWYDSADPRPDYYRNLPSYFYMENTDYNRNEQMKAGWTADSWQNGDANLTHVNWDRLYNINRNSLDASGLARSKYVQEERRTDQQDLNFAGSFKWRANNMFTLSGGLNAKINRTEYYKIIADLLGGDYYVNIDNFADRDFASSPERVQNDLDYYYSTGAAQILHKGDKYGYDYYAHVRNIEAWANGNYAKGNLSGHIAGRIGYAGFWREGLVRKGLFPGLDAYGNEYVDSDGSLLTAYDPVTGEVISSYGNSKKSNFLTFGVKAGAEYLLGGAARVYANVGYLSDAPRFNQAFLSPRTRNTLIYDLTNVKTFTSDVNFQYSHAGYNVRVTGFYTKIDDQTDLMSFYDDLQNAFTNFAMNDIDQRNIGVELGFKVPTPVANLAVQGVLSYGEYIYTSNPRMTQTIDNSADVTIRDEVVPYWQSHPVYDASGNFDHYAKHYVPSTPQLAASLGLAWNYNYWFIDGDVEYFDKAYLDMNPLYRTDMATAGPDGIATPEEIMYMAGQEKFDPAFLINLNIGKSWYIQRKYQLGFSLQVKNLLNNRDVRTGGYEQTRLVDSTIGKERYYRFDSKYFYMSGANYMLNIYFRF